MTDIYAELAARIADCGGAENVSTDMRARAKAAFWEAFRQLSLMPENSHLRRDETFDVAEAEEPVPAMVFIGTRRKRFACERCSATVFTRRGDIFTCNGCGEQYEGIRAEECPPGS